MIADSVTRDLPIAVCLELCCAVSPVCIRLYSTDFVFVFRGLGYVTEGSGYVTGGVDIDV